MSRSQVEAGSAFVRLFVRDGELRKGLKAAQASIESFADGASAVGKGMLAAGGAIAAPLTAAVISASGFQDVLLGIQASTGMVGDAMTRVRDAAIGMSAELGVGPEAAAQGMMELLKAGVDVETVLGGAGAAAIQFAKIAEMDVGQAAVVLSDAMNVFGVDSVAAGNALAESACCSPASQVRTPTRTTSPRARRCPPSAAARPSSTVRKGPQG